MQAWRIYYHKNEDYRYATRYNINYKDENRSMYDFISESMDKALNLGIDIAKMKGQILSTFNDIKTI